MFAITALRLVERQDRSSLTSLHNTKNNDVKAKCDCDTEFRKKFAVHNVRLINLCPYSYTFLRRAIHVHVSFM